MDNNNNNKPIGDIVASLKEKLEELTKQYKEVSEQAAQANTMKVKLEGAIEKIMSNAQQQREEMLKMVTETRAYQKTIFKKLDRIEEHLSKQNGRINNLEKSQSVVKGIGLTFSVIFSAILAIIKGEQ